MADEWDPRLSAIKRRRDSDELEALAATFRPGWKPGDKVQTWLRRHGPELTLLVREGGWAWDDIGRAMALAGVAYRSGEPIGGRLLCRKVSVARRQASPRTTVPPPRPAPAPTISGEPATVEPTPPAAEPKFKLVKAVRPLSRQPSPERAAPAPAQPEQPQRSREEVLALLRGVAPTDKS